MIGKLPSKKTSKLGSTALVTQVSGAKRDVLARIVPRGPSVSYTMRILYPEIKTIVEV